MTTPTYHPGDRVRTRLGSLATIVADDQPQGYISIQFDFDDLPSVSEVGELDLVGPIGQVFVCSQCGEGS